MFLDKEKDPHFSQPIRQIVLMVLVLGLVGFGVFVIHAQIWSVLLSNPYLNGFIVAVFGVGVLACFWQVLQLMSSVSWIEGFALDRPGHEFVKSPRLMASLAALLSDRGARKGLTSGSSRSILDSVATRLDETRDITRYIINLLIFLGLLGTFYGLATTIPALVDTIRSLAPQEGEDSAALFVRLISGLDSQLSGMGTAFASSLLGLAGSLIVGMLDLFAGHGQNRFYMELEEWLSSITRLGVASSDDGMAMPTQLLETGDHLEAIQAIVLQAEESRRETDAQIAALTGTLANLVNKMGEPQQMPEGTDNNALAQMVAGQAQLIESQQKLLALWETRDEDTGALDAETRMRLRNIDTQLLRIFEEMSAGRADSVAEIRTDLNTLSDALRGRG